MHPKFVVSTLVLISFLAGNEHSHAAKKMQNSLKPKTCIATWQIDRHQSPWSGLTSTFDQEQKSKSVAARNTPYSDNNLIRPVDKLIDPNDFILMRLPDSSEVTVNAAYFSDLTRADVTRMSQNESATIGKATPTALKKFTPRGILTLLLHYQIIISYAHIEANVCLVEESQNDTFYEARLTGTHIYYTNSRNESSYEFVFILDKTKGAIQIIGR